MEPCKFIIIDGVRTHMLYAFDVPKEPLYRKNLNVITPIMVELIVQHTIQVQTQF